jgi:putative NADH-flavin reductase
MKLALFGASGKTGRHLVEQALAKEYSVTALARTPDKLARYHDRLKVIQGDIRDASKVAEAVAGADAVLSVL